MVFEDSGSSGRRLDFFLSNMHSAHWDGSSVQSPSYHLSVCLYCPGIYIRQAKREARFKLGRERERERNRAAFKGISDSSLWRKVHAY